MPPGPNPLKKRAPVGPAQGHMIYRTLKLDSMLSNHAQAFTIHSAQSRNFVNYQGLNPIFRR